MANETYKGRGTNNSKNYFKGGVHVVKVVYVKDDPRYTTWYVDICDESDIFFGHFNKVALGNLDNWKPTGKFTVYKNSTYHPEKYQNTIKAIEESNSGYVRNPERPMLDVGKMFCLVWREEEFKGEFDKIIPCYKPYEAYSIRDFENGNYMVPYPYLKYTKPYKPKEESYNHNEPKINIDGVNSINQPLPQIPEQPKEEAFPFPFPEAVDDDDLPF